MQGYGQADQIAASRRNQKEAEKKAINSRTASYIDRLNSNVDLTKLSDTQQQGVTSFLSKKKNEYAQLASEISRIEDPTSQRYLEIRDAMNGIQNSFSNLASGLKSYKEDRVNYLQDFDSGKFSEGNDIESLSAASKLYVDRNDFGISESGDLMAWNDTEGNYTSYADFKKPFLKDFKSADEILKIGNSLYNSGTSLNGARKLMIRNQLNQLISKGGKQSLISLAKDDFMIPGGLGIQDETLFEPGNEAQLKEVVINSYLEALGDTARQGANDKRPASSGRSAGLSGAMQDEVAYGAHEAENAFEFASMAGAGVNPSIITQQLNSVDPTKGGNYMSREEVYKGWLQREGAGNEEDSMREFNKKFPASQQIFLYNSRSSKIIPINVDINDKKDLFRLYLRNSNLSNKVQNHYISNFDQNTTSNTKQTNTSGALDNL